MTPPPVARIAGIAATVAFVGALLMAALTTAGVLHLRWNPIKGR
jgi:hypothetical protein